MAKSCRLSPVVFKREGTQVKEVDSKLYKDIKKAVGDRNTAWKMWAYTKTDEFKKDYKNLEYDELGEVTFPSLIKALGLEESYNNQKSIEEVERDYGFTNTIFENSEEAVTNINEFNAKEDKYIAVLQKESNGYSIHAVPRNASNVQIARDQSYNHALSREIIDLLRSLGFNVDFSTDPRYAGLFDPTNATLENGLITIIRIAKGERGEEALPEEFSHLIIEGLQNHPLVQRLFATLDDVQLHEIFGNQYEDYYNQYNGDSIRMKKEAAGKLLAQHIKKEGTIKREVIEPKKPLLTRIWNWAKGLFKKAKQEQIDNARERAHNYIADIYNLVASEKALPLIDKQAILSGEQLFKLTQKYDKADKLAYEALTIHARIVKLERDGGIVTRKKTDTFKTHQDIQEYVESNEYKAVSEFLKDTKARLQFLQRMVDDIRAAQEKGTISDIKEINQIAKLVRQIDVFDVGYGEIIRNIAAFGGSLDIPVGLSDAENNALNELATTNLWYLNNLKEFGHNARTNIMLNASRTVYKEDKVRGIGSKRDEVMALDVIIHHAERDINFVDRWISAMSDADDALLTIIDGIVKNQQYERDMEMIEWKARIDSLDKKLRDAGYSSDFMYERDAEGVPTGRIISPYDWDTYNKERTAYQEELLNQGITGRDYYTRMNQWKETSSVKIGTRKYSRLKEVFVDPALEKLSKEEGFKKVISDHPDAVTEWVPNPAVYNNKANLIENLPQAQKDYYYAMMEIKRQMMTKIPHRGQGIYRVVNISKDLVEGVLSNSTGNIAKAVKDNYVRKFVRRPDDIGFGITDDFTENLKEVLNTEKDSKLASEAIIKLIEDAVDEDIALDTKPKTIKKIIDRHKKDENKEESVIIDEIISEIIDTINSENFYLVETDFANHRVQRLPVYYTRRLKDKRMLSTDFTSTLMAYSTMAVNYEKMNEVVDILEVARDYVNDPEGRKVLEKEGDSSVYSKMTVFGKSYKSFVEKAAGSSSIAGRLNDYLDAVVYEERKLNEGSINVLGVNLDYAKTLDAIKDYTGLIGLGFNIFSTVSNLTVGKVQQWIEAVGGEYFTVKDYAKAVAQYGELLPGCLAEMNSPIKKNKLSLLIQQFDPMGDYYESLRNPNYSKNPVTRILGNGVLAYIGMNAGEHILHCQTMLAILNNIKLTEKDKNGKETKISLYDALEVKEGEDGITRLVLKEGLTYSRELIDHTGSSDPSRKDYNKNYGKPLKDSEGKIVTEIVSLDDDTNKRNYLIKKKRIIRKVNDSLNGAFNVNDKGAAHRKALNRLLLQFRQWMPAHYMRRFARAHYDNDLEQWREGYYVTVGKILNQMRKEAKESIPKALTMYSRLSEHERANLRRANAEIGMFTLLFFMCKFGGRVKDRDRSWADKMAFYQMHRAFLEVGASVPSPAFISNIFQLLQSPAAAVNTLQTVFNVLNVFNMFDEVESGKYQGWSEWSRDTYKATPAIGQISKALDFDDSMFTMFPILQDD